MGWCGQVRVHAVKELAQKLRPQFEAVLAANDDAAGVPYSPDAHSAARRAVKAKALSYLSSLGENEVAQAVLERFRKAENMTDKISCLSALNDSPGKTTQGMYPRAACPQLFSVPGPTADAARCWHAMNGRMPVNG